MTCTTSSLTSQSQLPSCNFWQFEPECHFCAQLGSSLWGFGKFEPKKCLFGISWYHHRISNHIQSYQRDDHPCSTNSESTFGSKLGWIRTTYNLHLIDLPSWFVAAWGRWCPMQPSDSSSHDQPGHQEYSCKLDSCNGLERFQQHSPLWQSCFKLLSWSASCTLRRKAGGIMRSDPKLLVVTCMQFHPQGLVHANVPKLVSSRE